MLEIPAELEAAAIADGTLPGQRMVTSDLAGIAGTMKESGVGAPAIVVIGNVVEIAAQGRGAAAAGAEAGGEGGGLRPGAG